MKIIKRFIITENELFQMEIRLTYYITNNSINSCIYYRNGLKHGLYKAYFIGGKIDLECYFKNDKLNGPYKSYFSDGFLWIDSYYRNGLEHGKTIYNDRNIIHRNINYFENGVLVDVG